MVDTPSRVTCAKEGTKLSKKSIAISILGLACLIGPAWGSTVVYCNESVCGANTETAFNTATSALSFGSGFEDFLTNGSYAAGLSNADGITGLDYLSYNSSSTQEGVTVTSNVLDENASGVPNSIEIELPSNVYAFGATFSTQSGGAAPCIELVSSPSQFTSNNCNYQLGISSPSDVEFFGVVSSTPLTDIFIGSINGAGDPRHTSLNWGHNRRPRPR